MGKRSVKRVAEGKDAVDGAGVHLRRVISRPDIYDFDPFLMLDSFDSKNAGDYINGFPWHPHRGIETITYLISGDIEHGDSLGNRGSIRDGQCQWMTAGSGIIHQEMPKSSPHMWGVQLWLNLPRKDKMSGPAYRDITAGQIKTVEEDNATVRILSGTYKGHDGAIQGGYTAITFLDIDLKPGKIWMYKSDPENTVFVFIAGGSASFEDGGGFTGKRNAVLLTAGQEDVVITASEEGARLLLLSGRPLNEEIAWGGPIVMNTPEELHLAFKELEEDTFIKHG